MIYQVTSLWLSLTKSYSGFIPRVHWQPAAVLHTASSSVEASIFAATHHWKGSERPPQQHSEAKNSNKTRQRFKHLYSPSALKLQKLSWTGETLDFSTLVKCQKNYEIISWPKFISARTWGTTLHRKGSKLSAASTASNTHSCHSLRTLRSFPSLCRTWDLARLWWAQRWHGPGQWEILNSGPKPSSFHAMLPCLWMLYPTCILYASMYWYTLIYDYIYI